MDIRKLSGILWLLLSANLVWAENGITGRVLDYSTRQVIDYANVSLSKGEQNEFVTGATTDADGTFHLSGMANGTYTISVSFMGYNEWHKTVTLQGKVIDLGKIYLTEDTQSLNEVEVVGQGTTMRFELDKRVFSVDQNIASSGGSATDALEQVPSIDVDQEGNISLRNSEAVEIWINGKPSGLVAENRAQVLQQMPAESIKEIEVITNPSAKYSPEGTAGIINLVMKKDKKAGYYGSVNLNLDYCLAPPWNIPPGGRAGFNFNFSRGIVDGYINLGYHYHSSNGTRNSDRYNFGATDTTRLIKQGNNNHRGGGMFVRAGLDLRVTDRSIIGLSGFGMVSAKNDKTNGGFSSVDNSPAHYTQYDVTNYLGPKDERNSEVLTREYDRNEQGTGCHPGGNVMLDWRFEINKQHKLSMSAQYMQFGMTNDLYYIQKEYDISDHTTVLYDETQEQVSDNLNRSTQLKADYEWKPTEQSRLEAGWQTDLSWRRTNAEAWNGQQKEEYLNAYYNDFSNNEQTHALYITYGNRFWQKFSVQVGLRGEYFLRHIESTYYDEQDNRVTDQRDTSYFQLFPSAYLSYDFGHGHELQLNYTRRVDRPRGRQINPRQDFSDSTNISYGNPDLLPQYSSSLELNYLKYWERHVISAGLFYRFADNVIQNIKFMDEDVMRNTFINVGRRHEAGAEVIIKNRFFGELLQLTTSGEFFYNRLDKASYTPVVNGRELSEVTIDEQNIFAGSVKLNIAFLFTKTFSGQISGRYFSPSVIAQGQRDHHYSIDLGLRKTFLDKRLALALNVRDLLDSRARRNTTYSDSFWQYQENRWSSRTISLNITYNFGNQQPKRHETNNHNTNDSAGQFDDAGADD